MDFRKDRLVNRLRSGRRRAAEIGGGLQKSTASLARRMAEQTGESLKHTGESLVAVERSMVRTAKLHPMVVSLIAVGLIGLIVGSFFLGRTPKN